MALSLAGSAAAGDGFWLHVRVDAKGASAETVHVNVPLSMVEALLPMIEAEGLRHGKLDLDWRDDRLSGIDLREVLQALRESPDTEFVTVRAEAENVRVAKERGFLIVHVDEQDEKVRVRVPLDVVEALFVDDDRLDLVGALRRLASLDGGEIVTVDSDDESVRIWIDADQGGD
jgi:hypothetical protein